MISKPKQRDMPLLRKAMDEAIKRRDEAEWDNDFPRADYWQAKYEEYKSKYESGEDYAVNF